MTLYFNHTQPFSLLQKSIGHSTYRLNTIFVGLNCIANGKADKEDAEDLHITWEPPTTEENRKSIANQTKIFACSSGVILGADIVDFYLRSIVTQEWAPFKEQTVNIVTKRITQKKRRSILYKKPCKRAIFCFRLTR